jgi:hypothetical protein
MIELKVHTAGVCDSRETKGIFPKFGLEPRFPGAVPPELRRCSNTQLLGA